MNNPNYEAITEEEVFINQKYQKTAMIEWSSNLNKNVKQNINFSDLIQ